MSETRMMTRKTLLLLTSRATAEEGRGRSRGTPGNPRGEKEATRAPLPKGEFSWHSVSCSCDQIFIHLAKVTLCNFLISISFSFYLCSLSLSLCPSLFLSVCLSVCHRPVCLSATGLSVCLSATGTGTCTGTAGSRYVTDTPASHGSSVLRPVLAKCLSHARKLQRLFVDGGPDLREPHAMMILLKNSNI